MISIISAVYNEEDNIPILVAEVEKTIQQIDEEFEFILVDDGSSDRSLEIIKEIHKEKNWIKVISFTRNFGQQAALTAGLAAAKGEAVILIDADLQDPPELIPELLNKWKQGYKIVYTVKTSRKENFLKKFTYFAFYRLLKSISYVDIQLDSGDFSLLDRKVVDIINRDFKEKQKFLRGIRSYIGYEQVGIEYDRNERLNGSPKYSFIKLQQLALDGLIGYSLVPLRLATYVGAIVSIISFLAGIFFIFHRLLKFNVLGNTPVNNPGIATAIVASFFLSGFILMILGVIGEYIGRIYAEVTNRPIYLIKEEIL